jgi:hypothetical protein
VTLVSTRHSPRQFPLHPYTPRQFPLHPYMCRAFTMKPPCPPDGRAFLTGFLQGAANPGPFVNWTLFISFLIGHRLLDPSPAGTSGFAVGVGLGVFSWFTLLIRTAHRLKDHSGPWVARSTVAAGAFLLATGFYFGLRSLASS